MEWAKSVPCMWTSLCVVLGIPFFKTNWGKMCDLGLFAPKVWDAELREPAKKPLKKGGMPL